MPAFLVDENLPASLAEALVSRGIHAETVANKEALRCANDQEIMAYAQSRGLVIISKDKDFADVTQYPLGSHAGVVCVRLPNRMAIDDQVAIVTSVITSLDPGEVAGSIVVIEAGRVRLRRKSR